MSLNSSSNINGEGSTTKDPLYKILDELRSLKLWKEKQERKEKGKKRVEEISQDEKIFSFLTCLNTTKSLLKLVPPAQ